MDVHDNIPTPEHARRALGRPVIGLLAGMGVRSTGPFLDLVATECQRQYGAKEEADYPVMVVFSWPSPFVAERPLDEQAMLSSLQHGLLWLQTCGVDLLAMPCNTAHIWFDALEKRVAKPLLDMIDGAVRAVADATADRATNGENRPVAALFSTRATRDAGMYQRRLEQQGIAALDDEALQKRVDGLLQGIHSGNDLEKHRGEWHSLLRDTRERGADLGLVACTDLNVLFDQAEPAALPLVDGTRALAADVVRHWRSLADR